MRNTVKLSTLALLVASLSACSAGPDYQRPEKVESINLSQPYQQAEQALNWWQAFDDAELNQLVERALEQNRTLAQARANVDRAYAVFRDADNDSWPKGTLETGYQASENNTLSADDDDVITRWYSSGITRGYSSGANLSWDLDLFGKLRRASATDQSGGHQLRRISWSAVAAGGCRRKSGKPAAKSCHSAGQIRGRHGFGAGVSTN